MSIQQLNVRQQLETIKDPTIRELALKNAKYELRIVPNVPRAIDISMTWTETPEGAPFWTNIYEAFKRGEQPKFEDYKDLI